MAIFTLPIARVGDSNYRVGSGYKLYFYAAGTTTAKDTYTSNTYTTPLSNPVVADASGYFSVIWTSGDYKVRLYTDANVLVWEVDNYTNDSGVTTFAEGVLSSPSSAANVITASLSTAPAYPYVDQLQVVVELQHGANTIYNPTFNLNSLGAKTIKRDNNQPLYISDTGGSGYKLYLSYSATNDVWILLNPANTNKFGLGLEWKNGLLVSNNVADATNDIDIAVGSIMDTTNVYRINLTSALTIPIDAVFNVAAGGGRSDQDSLTNDTWYGAWVLSKSTNTSDTKGILATTKAKSLADTVAMAAGYNISRLVGYVRRGTATNLAFVNSGNGKSMWDVPISNVTAVSTAGATSTVTIPPSQTGILGYYIGIQDSDTSVIGFGSIRQVGQTIAVPVAVNCDIACEVTVIGSTSNPTSTSTKAIVYVKADTSSQVQHRESAAVVSVDIAAKGWVMDYAVTDLV
jgi:hypothetical protein